MRSAVLAIVSSCICLKCHQLALLYDEVDKCRYFRFYHTFSVCTQVLWSEFRYLRLGMRLHISKRASIEYLQKSLQLPFLKMWSCYFLITSPTPQFLLPPSTGKTPAFQKAV